MNMKSLKEKLINAINNVFNEFDDKKDTEDICDDNKDATIIIANDLEKISKKWSINFQNVIHGVESSIIFNKNIPNQLFFKWELESTIMEIDEKSLEVLKYKSVLNLPIFNFNSNGGKLTLELEYWKHRPENIYAGDNEGMVRYDIILDGDSKICGNTDLESPKQIIDSVEKVLYDSHN